MNDFSLRGYRYVRPTMQRGGYRWVSRFFTLTAAVIVFLVHAVWIAVIALHDKPPQSAPDAELPGLVIAPAGFSPVLEDVQLVRSPVLMSLPSRTGFSGHLLDKAELREPPELTGPPAAFLLDRDVTFGTGEYGETVTELHMLIERPRSGMPADRAALPAALSIDLPGVPVLSAFWRDRPGVDAVRLALGDGGPPAAATTWQADLFLCLDDAGQLSYAMFETPPADPEAAGFLLRAVRGADLSALAPGTCGILAVQYRPPAVGGGED